MIIMLVDDEPVSRTMLAEFLSKIGNRVIECIDADQALRIFPTEDFNMIISDYKMPGTNGLELLHNIRNLPGGQDVHIVIYTAENINPLIIKAEQEQAFSVLLKPISIYDLIDIVEKVKRQR